jgi:hypothetical protein
MGEKPGLTINLIAVCNGERGASDLLTHTEGIAKELHKCRLADADLTDEFEHIAITKLAREPVGKVARCVDIWQ